MVEAHHDGLGVAGGLELVAGSLQLLTEFEVVVDLAVEGHRVTGGGVLRAPLQRLVGVLQVDDREAVEAEDDRVVVPGPVFVGATVPHARQGVGDGVDVEVGVVLRGQESKKSTHGR